MSDTVSSPAIVRRRKIILCGFFGRGNAGDEAFLHVQHALLSPHFDIAVAIEQAGAYPKFREWYPYNASEVWSFDEVNRVYDSDVYGINIGGGSLPFGYHGHFLLSALDAGKKTLVTGVDAAMRSDAADDHIRRDIYGRLDYLAVRHKRSFKQLKVAGIPAVHGADWAIGLQGDDTVKRDLDVVITFRGFSEPNLQHASQVRALIKHLKSRGRRVTLLPFAPEDRMYLRFCGIPDWSMLNLWHNPKAALSAIERSAVTISVGRLHTLIFALVANKPCFAIDPGIMSGGKHILNRKNQYFCSELGLEFFDSIKAFIDADPSLGPDRFPARGFPDDYKTRYRKMTEGVLQALDA